MDHTRLKGHVDNENGLNLALLSSPDRCSLSTDGKRVYIADNGNEYVSS